MDTEESINRLALCKQALTQTEALHELLKGCGITSREFSLSFTALQEARLWFDEALIRRLGNDDFRSLVQKIASEHGIWDAPTISPN